MQLEESDEREKAYQQAIVMPTKGHYFSSYLPLDKLLSEVLLLNPKPYFPDYQKAESFQLYSPQPLLACKKLKTKLKKWKALQITWNYHPYKLNIFLKGKKKPDISLHFYGKLPIKSYPLKKDFYTKLWEDKISYKKGVFLPSAAYSQALRVLQLLEQKQSFQDIFKKEQLSENAYTILKEQLEEGEIQLPSPMDKDISCLPRSIEKHFMILWENGYRYRSQLLSKIRNYPNFRLEKVSRLKFKKFSDFLKKVYKKENNPALIKHKLSYLQDKKKEALFIELAYTGEKKRGIVALKELKEHLRNAFNPRDEYGVRTDKHILHTLDSPNELRNLNLP